MATILSDKFFAEYHKKEALSIPLRKKMQEKFHFIIDSLDVLVRDVADVYNGLPEEQRKDTAIVSMYYGPAGAVDQLGGVYGLPKAMCGHLNQFFFSLDKIANKTWIMIGRSYYELQQFFIKVRPTKFPHTKYRKPHQMPSFLCTVPKFTPEEAIIGLKRFE